MRNDGDSGMAHDMDTGLGETLTGNDASSYGQRTGMDGGQQQELQQPWTGNDTLSKAVAVDPAVAGLTGRNFEAATMDHLKPVVGMMFDTLTDVEKFYKSYAHDAGFSVRVGQHKKQNDEILFKRYYCSREGYRKENVKNVIDESGKKRKTHNVMETRCGCEAHIVVKLCSDKKYQIASMVEEHSHGFVSPDKRHLLRSNRNVSERAKSTLFSCHKASIGTSQAYRLLHVSEGGFQNVGCTLRDLQNYYRDLRSKIKDADAQMFVAQLERKKEVNPAFFYDFMVDEQGRLVRVFWADALCRKNYSIFGDVVSVDSTYTTNQYNMIFVPFTGVNHHLQSVFLGAAFLANEKIESYVWLFNTFLKAMRGVAPHLIITDEDASMKAAIAQILPDTTHRLCMWHIMEKVPEKVGPSIREDEQFWDRLHMCVWGSETSDDFESQWNSIVTDFALMGNDWFSTKFAMRQSWIPAYFMDIPLAGILRTTSRSESANSFFNRFIHRKLTFVEFWLRFDTALECQRQEELKADNASLHTTPKLMTPWAMEKQCSVIYTHEIFSKFQEQIVAARDHCIIQGITECEDIKIVTISSLSGKERVVQLNKSDMFGRCSCKLYESYGIPCRHIIQVLRAEKKNEIPSIYIMKRWEKRCKRELFFDEEGNLLDEKPEDPMEVAMQKKISDSRNQFEDLIQMAKNSIQGMDFLYSSLCNLVEPLQKITPATRVNKQDEYESFLGSKIPNEVEIHPPNDIKSKGRCKRIKKSKEMKAGSKGKGKRMCGKCKQVGDHDARNCPNNVVG
ncbi:protein FAR1-RELATED SEQUENCE 5-like [Setaria viridis]|uniref:protein FAR1-RELATED SEQUENCE 5-like n=1 Tax=Setaria viridis TaxID=4556 RepID=UPI003B3AC151